MARKIQSAAQAIKTYISFASISNLVPHIFYKNLLQKGAKKLGFKVNNGRHT